MFNKTIFKQGIVETWRLWLTFTLGISLLICLIIGIYDESTSVSLIEAVKGTSIEDLAGEKLFTITTLCGLLAEAIYGIFGILLATIYSFVVANSLIASEVDKGSLAYILSTPVKRITVVVTRAFFLVFSLAMMFLTIFIICSIAIQLKFGYIWGNEYTKDVKAVSRILDVSKEEISSNLILISDNPNAIKIGAEARDIHEDEYIEYLTLKMGQTDSLNNEKVKETLTNALLVASQELDIQVTILLSKMSIIKESDAAFSAALNETGWDEVYFTKILNQAIALQELQKDNNSSFTLEAWIMINVGCFLLMFATSGISFFASCFFNSTRNSLILGAGLPLSFFLLKLLASINLSMTELQYFSLNTLYVTQALANAEGYAPSLIILTCIGLILYTASFIVFKKKDLPL